MTDSGDPLARLSALECRLLELAEAGEWDALDASLQARDALLARLSGADLALALTSAQSGTRHLERLARAARAGCAREIAALKTGGRAAVSYVTVQKGFT